MSLISYYRCKSCGQLWRHKPIRTAKATNLGNEILNKQGLELKDGQCDCGNYITLVDDKAQVLSKKEAEEKGYLSPKKENENLNNRVTYNK